MQRFNTRALLFHGGTAALVAGAVGTLLSLGGNAPIWVYPLLALAALAYVALQTRRWLRRLFAPPPPDWIGEILAEKVLFYKRLPEAEQERFRRDVHYFLLDQHIVGINVELDDTLRVLTAASAVVLTFGLPDYEWDTTRDILIYPSAYTEDYEQSAHKGTRLGQVGTQGPIILSAEALHAGFANSTDGHNVGLHEFAHVLDFDDGEIDGLPANLNWQAARPWLDQMNTHLKRGDRKGKRGRVLRNYGYTNEAEFFACATEMFFEQPARLHRRAPELYDTLVEFYGQDPRGS